MQQDKYCQFRIKKAYKPFHNSLLTYCKYVCAKDVCAKTADDCDPECYKKMKEKQNDKS